ncbi:tol-pal system-associated acyl-CoA thioesterase [Ensifer sp. ENS12]|uniref:tol-pal system-associated acyl-CoA thioesterase n=1 Tax=Ensifer sp. ENS12 TaxID=2854774 RepID=UPI000DD6627B|nr:tol-pal system-associated acyl-CoA thioesterase [Ensifer sp. ENS12]MBV7519216.1 tol-pal system-associated acyl-CoA thioesterase [Ensifer sp. ENS12]
MSLISLAGELTENGHRLIQRVYYEDTDFSGVVYHARYLHFMERARTDFLRLLGVEQATLAIEGDSEGLVFVVHRMEIDFKLPARMDDILTITTVTEKAGGAKMVLLQEIRRGEQLLTASKVIIAVINGQGRPRRLPEALAYKFHHAKESAGQPGTSSTNTV